MKKDYLFPDHTFVGEGKIFPVYLNPKEQKKFDGFVELINYEPSITEDRLPYTRIEIGKGEKISCHMVIWTCERWKVKYISGPNKGFVTHRVISYFVTVNSNLTTDVSTLLHESMDL